jgi:hypothetical protein
LRCRGLVGNRLEGRVPPSLLAMPIPLLVYVPPSVSALERFDAEPRTCVVAASSRKRAALSHGTHVRAKTMSPTTSACAWAGRCAARPLLLVPRLGTEVTML